MPGPVICGRCGFPLPKGAAEGLCPLCLLESGLADTITGEEAVVLPDPATGRHPDFGSYHAIGVLGEGGMGIVYLAEQREPIRRRVALKVLKRGDDRPSFIARFESERQALAMMDHPNIARVFAAGATEDGRPYFAMEYVPGIPITEYCDRNMLGFGERLLLFQQVCLAVQHAHQKGIIHRDLKPSNVLVTLQDGRPVPKVIDFGVAKAVNQRLTERTLFTETGMLVGTPEYMSPEQANLTGLDIDTATDVYSLGVMLYELLVGALPFDSKMLRKAGYAEIQRVIREEEPPRPTTRLSTMGQPAQDIARRRRSDVRTLVRLLRGDLEWITMKALEKDRARRYSSASEFAADIGRHLANEPVAAGPPTARYVLAKLLRRHRGQVLAAAAILLSVIGGLVASTVLYFRADAERSAAEWQGYKASLAAASSDIAIARSEDARSRLRSVPKRRRGWEWNYLYWRSDRAIANLNTGEGGTSRIGFSPDGSQVLVSSRTSVHAWELVSFRRSGEYGPFPEIRAMTRDGSRLACWPGNQPGPVQIVETFTGKLLSTLESRGRTVDASFNGDGSRLATLSDDNEIAVWATDTGRKLQTIPPPARAERRELGGVGHELIVLSPDGRRVAASRVTRILLCDAVTGREVETIETQGQVQALAFNADGTRLLSSVESVRIWDGLTGRSLSSLSTKAAGGVLMAAESPDGLLIADTTWYREVHIWDRASGQLIATIAGPRTQHTALHYSPDGKYLFCANLFGEVSVWDGPTVGGLFLRFAKSEYRSMDLNADGNRLAVADGRDVQVLNTRNGEVLDSWSGHTATVLSVACDPQGDAIASGSEDGSIFIWNPRSQSPRLHLAGHQGPVNALSWSPDGKQLASASGGFRLAGAAAADQTIRFWDATTGRNRLTRKFEVPVRSVVFSPDGSVLLAILNTRAAAVLRLDAATGADLPPLDGVSRVRNPPWRPAFSPGGGRIAAGSMWEASTGRQLQKLENECQPSYVFSPDGSRLFGSFNNATLNIWRTDSGERIFRLDFENLRELVFSPDGRRLYANEQAGIRIFDVTPAVPPEADELYESLAKRFPLYCDMREFLRQDRETDARLREIVLRMIDGRPEEAVTTSEMVLAVIYSANAGTAAYEQALRRARLISQPRPWDMSALAWVGAAQYRSGDYTGAVATLEQAARVRGNSETRTHLFMAMAHYRLGHTGPAHEFLERARTQISGATGSVDLPVQELFREAQSLMAPK